MDKTNFRKSLVKEILYVFLFFNIVLLLVFTVVHIWNTNTEPILGCYTSIGTYPEKAPCNFMEFTLQSSIGYLFIILPLEVIAVLGLAFTAILRKVLDRKIKKLSKIKSFVLTTVIFFTIWIGVVIPWVYPMIHKNI